MCGQFEQAYADGVGQVSAEGRAMSKTAWLDTFSPRQQRNTKGVLIDWDTLSFSSRISHGVPQIHWPDRQLVVLMTSGRAMACEAIDGTAPSERCS